MANRNPGQPRGLRALVRRWLRACRTVAPPGVLRPGSRVCVVYMDGCMAHVRNGERWGVVLYLEHRVVYGSSRAFLFARTKYDNGTEDWQPAAPNELQYHVNGNYFERQI